MALNFITRDASNVQDGQTPLDPDEKAGLIPAFIETKGALNDWEQENILQAIKWLQRVKAPLCYLKAFAVIYTEGCSTKPGSGQARFVSRIRTSVAIGPWSR